VVFFVPSTSEGSAGKELNTRYKQILRPASLSELRRASHQANPAGITYRDCHSRANLALDTVSAEIYAFHRTETSFSETMRVAPNPCWAQARGGLI
jgi:hypothetical protein